ncbi:hypothetical protein EWM64_g9996 [Hericium alpestre]|uniref:5'-nucleotidase n=1 Tax=Hericium alpestre TaxID=135208 RepID=A0A4Y9ZGY7_9AGAM|nr:hypothetical protein EWM64_g9996 [Hericium alpestre]
MTADAAPESTLPYPPIHADKQFVVLSDWDGTITTRDSNDYLTDNLGMGIDKRRELNDDIVSGKSTFREDFRRMLDSVAANGHKFEECKKVLRENIVLDPGFKAFYKYCKAHDIPVIIVSSGMEPIIRAVLSNLLADEAAGIEIISNAADVKADDSWSIKYRHPSSHFGHDKSQAILPYNRLPNPPTLFFFGDGVSGASPPIHTSIAADVITDMSAARHADVLFVKTKDGPDNDLHKYCQREGIPHILFRDFSQAVPVVQDVVEGRKTKEEVLAAGKAW